MIPARVSDSACALQGADVSTGHKLSPACNHSTPSTDNILSSSCTGGEGTAVHTRQAVTAPPRQPQPGHRPLHLTPLVKSQPRHRLKCLHTHRHRVCAETHAADRKAAARSSRKVTQHAEAHSTSWMIHAMLTASGRERSADRMRGHFLTLRSSQQILPDNVRVPRCGLEGARVGGFRIAKRD